MKRALNVLFVGAGLVCGLLSLSSCDAVLDRAKAKKEEKQRERETERIIEEGKREMAREQERLARAATSEEGVDDDDFQALEDTAVRMAERLEAQGGEEAKLGRIMAAYLKTMNEKSEELDATLLEQALDFRALREKGDYSARRGFLETYRKANAEFQQWLEGEGQVAEMERLCDQENLAAVYRRDFLAGVRVKMEQQLPPTVKLRELDDALCVECLEVIKLLEDNDEAWEWDVETEQVAFEHDEHIEAFNQHFSTIDKIATEQGEIQAEVSRAQ